MSLKDQPVADPPDALRDLAVMPGWLTDAADPAAVTRGLQTAVPELASGERTIVDCVPKLRMKDGPRAGWSASYRVTVADQAGARETVELVGTFQPPDPAGRPAASTAPFGSEAWTGVIPDLGLELTVGRADDALPTLPMITDPDAAARLLEEALQGPYPGTRVVGCRPEVMRHKPGSRCTIRYELDLDRATANGAPTTVVAKTYRGEKGANAFAGMQALWDAEVASGAVVSLAEPIAYRHDLRLLVQGPVEEERTLKDLVRSTFAATEDGRAGMLAGVAAELAKTADGLAALHDSGIDHGEVVTWEEELADVRNLIERLRPQLPEAAAAVTTFLDGIEARSGRSAAEPVAPCHRSFRPAQVLLHQGRIAFIDFDGLAMAEPALDVALFRAAVRDVGAGALLASVRPPAEVERALDDLDALCDGFLARYRSHRPIAAERVMLWETLDLVTYVLHCWTKIKSERLVTRMTLLDRHIAGEDLG